MTIASENNAPTREKQEETTKKKKYHKPKIYEVCLCKECLASPDNPYAVARSHQIDDGALSTKTHTLAGW